MKTKRCVLFNLLQATCTSKPIAVQFRNETEFNSWMREVLRSAGLGCLHIREADIPGPSDLIIWKGPRIIAWIELKIDDEPVRPSQKEFLRERRKEGSLALVFRFKSEAEEIEVCMAEQTAPFATVDVRDPANWADRLTRWNELFTGKRIEDRT